MTVGGIPAVTAKIIHPAVWTSDLDQVREIYVDHLGLEEGWGFNEESGVENLFLADRGGTEYQFKYDPTSREAIEPSGIDHVGVLVDDVDVVFDDLIANTACQVRMPPATNEERKVRYAFIEDHDGYGIELVHRFE